MTVKMFLMFNVAENIESVNIYNWNISPALHSLKADRITDISLVQ